MRLFAIALFCGMSGALGAAPERASADILISVSKSTQRMTVIVDGTARYFWPISSGREGYTTPNGVYQAEWAARKWFSRKYDDAPMPFSIFFHEGYALHGTTEISRLGHAASHGCVRLHPDNASKLFNLVKNRLWETRVVVSNDVIEAPGMPPKELPKNSPLLSQGGSSKTAALEPMVEIEFVGLDARKPYIR